MTEKQKQEQMKCAEDVKKVLHKLEQGEAEFFIGVGGRYNSEGQFEIFPALVGGVLQKDKNKVVETLSQEVVRLATPDKLVRADE